MNKDLHTDPGGPSGIHEDLLVKFLLGETSPDDNARVEAWLSADPANRHYYDHFQLIWRESRHLGDAAQGTDEQEEAAWEKFRQRIHHSSPERTTGGSTLQAVKDTPDTRQSHRQARIVRISRPTWARIAAVLFLAASITAVIYLIGPGAAPDKLVASTTTPLTDTLPDGSLITLNKQSDIQYPAKFKKDRTVHLQGEAFFKIAPNKEKPFKVYTDGITITVLGTSFNVRNKGNTTEIIVESGLVRVTDSLHDVLVHPSEKLILHRGDTTLTKDFTKDQLYQYYRTKEFVCNNTPLWQLAASLEEAYNVKIEISDPALRQLQINTVFDNQSLDQILSIIKETFRIRIDRSPNRIIIQP